MATVKVLHTDGEEVAILQDFPDSIRLHLIAKENISNSTKEIGDFVLNEKHPNMYAIIARDELTDKNMPEAVRLGLTQLLKYLVEEDKKSDVILINYFEMGSFKSETAFICILKELMLTYFSEAFEDEVTLVIYNCKRESVSVIM